MDNKTDIIISIAIGAVMVIFVNSMFTSPRTVYIDIDSNEHFSGKMSKPTKHNCMEYYSTKCRANKRKKKDDIINLE
jgi:hypothetical protein